MCPRGVSGTTPSVAMCSVPRALLAACAALAVVHAQPGPGNYCTVVVMGSTQGRQVMYGSYDMKPGLRDLLLRYPEVCAPNESHVGTMTNACDYDARPSVSYTDLLNVAVSRSGQLQADADVYTTAYCQPTY